MRGKILAPVVVVASLLLGGSAAYATVKQAPAPASAQVKLPKWVCEPDGEFCSATTVINGETVALIRNADGDIFVSFVNKPGTQCGSFGLDKSGKYFTAPC